MKIRSSENFIDLIELKRVLNYNPENGKFTWLVSTGRRVKIGSEAGHVSNGGYILIRLNKIVYCAHRLAWFYMTGEWPKELIDHIDTNQSNNSWSNLREATHSQNQQNRNVSIKSKTKLKGVYLVDGRYKSYICLGTFDTPEEAALAYKKASILIHGEFANYERSV